MHKQNKIRLIRLIRVIRVSIRYVLYKESFQFYYSKLKIIIFEEKTWVQNTYFRFFFL